MTSRDTIFALSSGQGRAGIAVIRISGPQAAIALDRMAPPRGQPRYAAFRRIRHPLTGELLDEALTLWLPGPKSETGEDIAELHVHGGAAVIKAVLQALGSLEGYRLAEAGEFARRAFENGRLDLTAAEGLADLVDAETEAQRRQALEQAGGGLARLYDGWREQVLAARALAEAAIDFSDEGDVADDAISRAHDSATQLLREIDAHINGSNRGEIIRDGFRVVLAGPPNVGKSSLLNALARRDVAIVSPEAGTTRDSIEVRLDLGGYAVILTDTAGLRDTSSQVEQEGIRRTLARLEVADMVLWVVDAVAPDWQPPDRSAAVPAPILRVMNKVDLIAGAVPVDPNHHALAVSARTGVGLDDLVEAVRGEVLRRVGSGGGVVPTQQRHRLALAEARAHLQRFVDNEESPLELAAEELRLAADALARVVGRIGVEDVLGAIFGRFCIGK